jgi:MoxR-like ATPase
MATISFGTFNAIVDSIADARFPVLIRGRHGIGKSQLIYQFAGRRSLDVIERRASQMTEGDLIGLPTLEQRTNALVTKWAASDWFQDACERPVVLFFDEVDRGAMEVRQGLFELMDSRKLAGKRLHDDTLMFAAVNGGIHGSNYQVTDMDPAELDRYTTFDVEPTVEDWLTWGKDNVAGEVWDFINNNRAHLEHTDTFEPNKKYPSRRSWARASQALVRSKLIEKGATPELQAIVQGFVGFEASTAFTDFVRNYDRQVKVEDVLNGKALKMTKKFSLNEHLALIEKLGASKCFDKALSADEAKHVAEYYVNLPSEAATKIAGIFGKLNNPMIMKQNTTKGIASLYAVQILTGKKVS